MYPTWHLSPKISQLTVFFVLSAVLYIFLQRQRLREVQVLHFQQHTITDMNVFFFLFPFTLNHYVGSLTVFHHLTVKPLLLSFLYAWYHFWDAPLVTPVMERLALSLFVLCTNTSILLSLISPPTPPQKEFYLNSVKTDSVMLTWLCICK